MEKTKLRKQINLGRYDFDLFLVQHSGYSLSFLIMLAIENHVRGNGKVFYLDDLVSIEEVKKVKTKIDKLSIYFTYEDHRAIYRFLTRLDSRYISSVTRNLLRSSIINLFSVMSVYDDWIEREKGLIYKLYDEKDIIHIKASDTRDNEKKKALYKQIVDGGDIYEPTEEELKAHTVESTPAPVVEPKPIAEPKPTPNAESKKETKIPFGAPPPNYVEKEMSVDEILAGLLER